MDPLKFQGGQLLLTIGVIYAGILCKVFFMAMSPSPRIATFYCLIRMPIGFWILGWEWRSNTTGIPVNALSPLCSVPKKKVLTNYPPSVLLLIVNCALGGW